jgi:uncharacterized membrane protein
MAGQIVALLSAEGKLSFSVRNAFHNNVASEAMRSMSPSAERTLRETSGRDQQHDIGPSLLNGTQKQIQISK